MDPNMEMELKLRFFDDSVLEKILIDPYLQELAIKQSVKTQLMEAIYFDTPSGALTRAGIAYRIRRENSRWIATVKADDLSSGGLHVRHEWNIEVPSPQSDLKIFLDTPIGARLIQTVGYEQCKELLVTRFQRKSLYLTWDDGSRIELAADVGEIEAGGRKEKITEIELELKSGVPSVLLKLGAVLARRYSLCLESRSKFSRGLKLLGFYDLEKNKPKLSLDVKENVREAMGKVIIENIQHVFAVYEDLLERAQDQEMIRQFWIKWYRFCSLLYLAGPLMEPEAYGAKQEELHNFNLKLASLREFDVFMATCQDIIGNSTLLLCDNSFMELMEKEQKELQERLLSEVSRGHLTALLLNFWAWLLENPWQENYFSRMSLTEYISYRLSC